MGIGAHMGTLYVPRQQWCENSTTYLCMHASDLLIRCATCNVLDAERIAV
jgi:hypothetical protein